MHPAPNRSSRATVSSRAKGPGSASGSKIQVNSKRSNYYYSARRREQCRINQRRYREKQKNFKLYNAQDVEHLAKEIENLKRRRREILFGGECSRSPWRIVTDVFDLIEVIFQSPWCMENDKDKASSDKAKQLLAGLEKSFGLDVSVGGLKGVDALMEQLHKYSQSFGNPEVQFSGVKELAPGIITATARLGLTVSMHTLEKVSPHLLKMPRSRYDTQPLLAKRLLGKKLNCNCSMVFHFDDESGRVARVETTIDWVTPLLRVLGSLSNVSSVLDRALDLYECAIGGEENAKTV